MALEESEQQWASGPQGHNYTHNPEQGLALGLTSRDKTFRHMRSPWDLR